MEQNPSRDEFNRLALEVSQMKEAVSQICSQIKILSLSTEGVLTAAPLLANDLAKTPPRLEGLETELLLGIAKDLRAIHLIIGDVPAGAPAWLDRKSPFKRPSLPRGGDQGSPDKD